MMKTAVGAWSPRTLSSAIDSSVGLTWRHALFLLGLGAAAVLLHTSVHWPLKLPGHHGLEWMALLMFGRCASNYRWAAALSAFGAAGFSLLPPLGLGGDPLTPVIYLTTGLVVDLLYGPARAARQPLALLAVTGAVAHTAKPLLHWLAYQGFGWAHGSVQQGLAYPLATHLLFGFAGALIGAGLWDATRTHLKSRESR